MVSPIDYLRDVMLRQPPAPKPEPVPPRDIPWSTPARSDGACPCIAIYTRCYCHLRKPAAR